MVSSIIHPQISRVSRSFADPSEQGMWLFDERVVRQHKIYNLIVKIEAHRVRDVADRREGRVLADEASPIHPIPKLTPVNVLVKYTDRNQVERIESMPVTALRTTSKLKPNGKHVVVMGENIGELVTTLSQMVQWRGSSQKGSQGQRRSTSKNLRYA